MSRYTDHSDDDSPEAVLARGRWEHNYRRALNGRRGQAALALLRESIRALPEPRLIEAALCTVGGVDRAPEEITEEEITEAITRRREAGFDRDPEDVARWMRLDRARERDQIASNIEGQGCGVCAIGALLWHLRVLGGMTEEEAFASLPALISADDCDPLDETAALAAMEADIAHTLAEAIAFRNDEIYAGLTPEARHTAFLAWIDAQIGPAEVVA
jgi:hypothetical protein